MADFDIHVAVQQIGPEALTVLHDHGFHRDDFRPASSGLVWTQYFAKHPTTIDELDHAWESFTADLRRCGDGQFVGFAEVEFTPPEYRAKFSAKPFDASVLFPFEPFAAVRCPDDRHKLFDVHIVAAEPTLDPCLNARLQEAGFYVVDIVKGAACRRCYTIQAMDLRMVPAIFDGCRDYLDRAGGLEGKLKIELVRAMERFPETAQVPPVITTVTALH